MPRRAVTTQKTVASSRFRSSFDKPETGLAEVSWRSDIEGWGKLAAEERDRLLEEVVLRLDAIVDPDGRHGAFEAGTETPAL